MFIFIQAAYYFHYGFQVKYADVTFNINNIGEFFISLICFSASLLTLYSIYSKKKWSWLFNALISFTFIFYYTKMFVIIVTDIVFLSHYTSHQGVYAIPFHIVHTIIYLILPLIVVAIFILLLRPEVKEYFKNEKLEGLI